MLLLNSIHIYFCFSNAAIHKHITTGRNPSDLPTPEAHTSLGRRGEAQKFRQKGTVPAAVTAGV